MLRIALSLLLLNFLVFPSFSAEGDLTYLCDDINGQAAYIGPKEPAGKLGPDGFKGGLLVVSIGGGGKGLSANTVFRDSTGKTTDARKSGYNVSVALMEGKMWNVTVIFDNAIETYIINAGSAGKIGLVMTQTKMILGHYKTAVFVGSCTSS